MFAVPIYLIGLGTVLVHGPDPRHGQPARPGDGPLGAGVLRRPAGAGLAWLGDALGALAARLPADRHPRRAAGRSRCTAGWPCCMRSVRFPGWHSTIFPPFFIIGAVFNGFAVVRDDRDRRCGTPSASTSSSPTAPRHPGQVLLATGVAVGYCYVMEAFTAWYSGDLYERQTLWTGLVGHLRLELLGRDRLQRRLHPGSVVAGRAA